MLALTLHPTERRKPNHSVRAKLRWSPVDGGKLLLFYEVQGAEQIVLPTRAGARPQENSASFAGERRDELWKATCFECFLGPVSQLSYIEWNFSLIGDWAAYFFTDYRGEMMPASVAAPQFFLSKKPGRIFFEVETDLPDELLASVSDVADFSRYEASLTAVIIEANEEKPFYWAVEHRREKPDFHARESFTRMVER
jgi:hypothetical protein